MEFGTRIGLVVVSALTAGLLFTQSALADGINFQNTTSSSINQTQAEESSNEKEVASFDFDNDGDLDVLVGNGYSDFGTRRNKLYRNDAGVFNEISALVPLFTGSDVARNALVSDFDADGWKDFIIVCDNNTGGDPGRTKYYRNNHVAGNHVGFVEEGNARLGPSTGGAACGAVVFNADGVNGDDLYVGNYPGPSQDTMYLNNGNGFFNSVTSTMVPTDSDYTVDVASGDLNNDGQIDLLIANWTSDQNWFYYNNLNNAGSGEGDFRYTGSTSNFPTGQNENAMEANDFNKDGFLDVYHSNAVGSQDRIRVGTGFDASNKLMVSLVGASEGALPSIINTVSRKATAADLDGDGLPELIVMAEGRRPVVLRNVSDLGGDIRFIDWTPQLAFPDGSSLGGWHADVFDGTGDGRADIFVGGWANDHFFEQTDSNEALESELIDHELPELYNIDPVAISGIVQDAPYVLEVLSRGTSSGTSGNDTDFGETLNADTYRLEGVPSGSIVSVVLKSSSDYTLEILNASGTVLATSDRDGLGQVEGYQITAPGGDLGVRVILVESVNGGVCTGTASCADLNNDGRRDNACVYSECVAGECLSTDVVFGDVGSEFGVCGPDATADGNDRFHTLNCFANIDPNGGPGDAYPCDDNAPFAMNQDIGGQFGSCTPDGTCDGNDAFLTLAAFEGQANCSCPLDPSPEFERIETKPVVMGQAELILVANRKVARPGELVQIDAYLSGTLQDLRGYQLHTTVRGGGRGTLSLRDIAIEQRDDHVFGGQESFKAFNTSTDQMLAGLESDGIAVNGRVYLASFTYRVEKDAAGTFLIDVLHNDNNPEHRTFLFATQLNGHIEITGTTPATFEVPRRMATRAR